MGGGTAEGGVIAHGRALRPQPQIRPILLVAGRPGECFFQHPIQPGRLRGRGGNNVGVALFAEKVGVQQKLHAGVVDALMDKAAGAEFAAVGHVGRQEDELRWL